MGCIPEASRAFWASRRMLVESAPRGFPLSCRLKWFRGAQNYGCFGLFLGEVEIASPDLDLAVGAAGEGQLPNTSPLSESIVVLVSALAQGCPWVSFCTRLSGIPCYPTHHFEAGRRQGSKPGGHVGLPDAVAGHRLARVWPSRMGSGRHVQLQPTS